MGKILLTAVGAVAAVFILAGGLAFADNGQVLSLGEMSGITGQYLEIDAKDNVITSADENNGANVGVGLRSDLLKARGGDLRGLLERFIADYERNHGHDDLRRDGDRRRLDVQ